MPPGPAELYELQERIGRGAFGTVYRAVPRARASGGARARGGGGGGAAAQQRPPVVAPHVAIKIVELEDMSDEIEDLQEEIAVLSSSAACPQLISYLGSYVVGACVRKRWCVYLRPNIMRAAAVWSNVTPPEVQNNRHYLRGSPLERYFDDLREGPGLVKWCHSGVHMMPHQHGRRAPHSGLPMRYPCDSSRGA